MQLSDYAQALGAAQRLVPNVRDLRQQDAQTQGLELRNQALTQDMALQQRTADFEAQEQAQFRSALEGLGAKPSPDRLYQLGVRFPKFAQTINQAAKAVTEDRRAGVVRQLAPIQALIQNGQTDKALAEVERHIAADKAAGQEPDENDVELRDMLASKDPAQIKAAGGIVYGLLAAVNPDTAAANIQKRSDSNTHVVSQGGALVGDDGTVLYKSDPAEANAIQVPIYNDMGERVGTQLIANGGRGGGQTSGGGGASAGSGGPVSGRTFGGWTPRKRNGGDNDDAAVDSKNAGMAKALGIGIDTPFPPNVTPEQIYEALTLSEGGRGSLADRNNNRGNLRDGKTLAYRKFGDKASGDAAAIAQVRRNLARGQNTIRTMVEGLPRGGASAADTGIATSVAGTIIGPVSSGGGSQFRLLSVDEKRAQGLDPSSQFQIDRKGRITPLGRKTELTEGERKATGLLASMVAAATSLNDVRGYEPSAVALALNDLSNKNPIKAKLSQTDRRVLNAQLAFSNSILRLESGAAIGKDEAAAKAQTLFPMPGDGPEVQADKRAQREAALKSMRTSAGGGADSVSRVSNADGRGQRKAGGNAPQGARLVGMYQGRQVYQLPNGKRIVEK